MQFCKQADTLKERYQKIGDTKRATPIEVLCENHPGMPHLKLLETKVKICYTVIIHVLMLYFLTYQMAYKINLQ